jgi:transposase
MDTDRRSAQVERREVLRRVGCDVGLKTRSSRSSWRAYRPRQVAATARRYGISRSLLLRWRRLFRPEPTGAAAQQVGFVPAIVIPESRGTPGPVGPTSGGAIEIEFAAGVRMRITSAVDAATL